MTQKYKVYINDRVIIFGKSKTFIPSTENQLICNEPSLKKINEIVVSYRQQEKADMLIFLTTDPVAAFEAFKLNYTGDFLSG